MKKFIPALFGALVILLVTTSSYGLVNVAPSNVDKSSIPQTTDQGWSLEERKQFYYTSGGSILLPCSWFLALEQKDNTDLFVADHNLAQLHLVPNILKRMTNKDRTPQLTCNESRLPTGIAITEIKDEKSHFKKFGTKWVGLTCAFCHTGEFHYTTSFPNNSESTRSDKPTHFTLYVDGGSTMHFNFRFLRELIGSLRATQADGDKLARFASRVFKMCRLEADPTETTCSSEDELATFSKRLENNLAELILKLQSRVQIDIAEWGFGRLDALGRGSNLVFGNLDKDNLRHSNAPVSVPPLWYAWRYDVVQWSGLIRHPIARNIGQTIAVGTGLFEFPWEPSRGPDAAFRSTIDISNIVNLENLIRQLKPPDWPGLVLKEIEPAVAMAGKQIYAKKCKGCHHPELIEHPKQAQLDRGQILKGKIISRLGDNTIGTDRTYLDNAINRYVSTIDESQGRDYSSLFDGQKSLPMAKAIQIVTTKILEQAKNGRTLKFPFDDTSDNLWEHPKSSASDQPIHGYLARPLVGIWATPPYLHNGSVPSIYDLLSPSKLPDIVLKALKGTPSAHIRPACFLTGSLEFDPEHLGYKVGECDIKSRPDNLHTGFNFSTTRPGNSNVGHEFTDYKTEEKNKWRKYTSDECRQLEKYPKDGVLGCALSHEERLAIIEYLKTCDLDDQFEWEGDKRKPWDVTAPPKRSCRNNRYEPAYASE